MTKGLRLAGGILALVGGSLQTIPAFMTMRFISCAATIAVMFLVTLTCAILGIVGGILLIKDKMAGGILALIGGVLPIIGHFITFGIEVCGSWWVGVSLAVTMAFYIDCIPTIVGAILGLAAGSDL